LIGDRRSAQKNAPRHLASGQLQEREKEREKKKEEQILGGAAKATAHNSREAEQTRSKHG
jgi:hypothetical protein